MAHFHLIGKSGSGKSTLLKHKLLQDIYNGHSVFYIDPHGSDIDDIVDRIPKSRQKDVLLIDPSQYNIPWNPLQDVADDRVAFTASTFVDSFSGAWGYHNLSTPRMDGVIYNSIVALIETNQPLFCFYLLMTSKSYRTHIVPKIKDPIVKRYWTWIDTLKPTDQMQQLDSTMNKVQILMSDSRMRQMFGGNSSFRLLDNPITLVRLPQGELGLQKTSLIGSLLLSQVHLSSLSRDTHTPLGIYVDEFHNFAPAPIAEMLSGIRKFNCHVVLSNQYLDQLDTLVRSSVLANTTQYVFQTSVEDARYYPRVGDFETYELTSHKYRVIGDGKMYDTQIAPLSFPTTGVSTDILTNMRRNFVRSSKTVDHLLSKF